MNIQRNVEKSLPHTADWNLPNVKCHVFALMYAARF